jgi:hypothetical protein
MSPTVCLFQAKLDHLDGGGSGFSRLEARWLEVLEEVALRHSRVPRATSFEVSCQALHRWYLRGKAGYRNYFRKACLRAHRTYVKLQRRRREICREVALLKRWAEPWPAVDLRLDVEEALGKMPPPLAEVVRLRLARWDRESIAAVLGVSGTHVSRMYREAKGLLEGLLASYAVAS